MSKKQVHLRFKCVDCGKVLGFYRGASFVFGVHGKWKRDVVERVELLCEECSGARLCSCEIGGKTSQVRRGGG